MDLDQVSEKCPSESCVSNPMAYRLPVVHTDSAPNPLVYCNHPSSTEYLQRSPVAPIFLPPSVGDSEDGTIMSYASDDAGFFSDTPFPFDDYLPTVSCTSHSYEIDSTQQKAFNSIGSSFEYAGHPSYKTADEQSNMVELTHQSFMPPDNNIVVSSDQPQHICFQPSSDAGIVSCGSIACNVPTMWHTSDSVGVPTGNFYSHVYHERQDHSASLNSDRQTLVHPEAYPVDTLNPNSWDGDNQYNRISSYSHSVSAYPNHSFLPESIAEYGTGEVAMYNMPVSHAFHPHTNNSYHITESWTYEQQPNLANAAQYYNQSIYPFTNRTEVYSFQASKTHHLHSETLDIPPIPTVKNHITGYWNPDINEEFQTFPTSFEQGAYSRELTEILPSNGLAVIDDLQPNHLGTTVHLSVNPAQNHGHGYQDDARGIFVKQLSYDPVSPTRVCDSNTFAFSDGVAQTSATTETQNEFHCSHCSKTFQRPSHLDIHMRTHTGERPYECILCGRHFSQVSNLRRHMESHKAWPPGATTALPPSCSMQGPVNQTASSNGYTSLQPSGTRKLRQWTCRFCTHTFSSYLSLRAHMSEHKEMRVFACLFQSCTRTFQTADALFLHVTEQHRNLTDRQSCTCYACNRTFTDARQLAQHWLPRRRGLPPRCRPPGGDLPANWGAAPERVGYDAHSLSSRTGRRRQLPASGARGLCRRRRLSVRLLRLRAGANLCAGARLRMFRCPLCSRRCRSLQRLRQHLATAEHTDQLAAVVRQSSVEQSATAPTTHRDDGGESPQGGGEVTQPLGTPVRKTALFLIHLEEEEEEVDRLEGEPVQRTGDDDCAQLYPNGRSAKSCLLGGKLMTCTLCGKQFQKLKFFEDHQLMCQQAADERARRLRLREQRKAHFRVSVSDAVGRAADGGTPAVSASVSPPDCSDSASFDSSAPAAGTNLRRSCRQRCFQQHWSVKRTRGFELAKQTSS